MRIAKKNRKPLPLVGPIAYYLPVRNGYPSIVGVTGELRLIAQATMRVVRGEFEGIDRFYVAIQKDGRNFLTAAGVAFFGAIGSNDPVLFDAVIKDIAAYPSRYGTPEAKFAAEIVMVWIRIFLRVPMTYPEWIVNLDLTSVPCEWRYQVSNLAVKYHNRYARDSVSEDLRPREFYIAHLLKHGVRYKEIAERTGMSEGRVRNMVSEIYDILHIRNAAEIGGLVW